MKHNIAEYAPILEKLTLPMQRYLKTYLNQYTFESRISMLPPELQEEVNAQITEMGFGDSVTLMVMEIPVSIHGELMALSTAIECLQFAERAGTVAYTPTHRDPYTWTDITGIPLIKGQIDAIIKNAEAKVKEAAKLVSLSSSSSSSVNVPSKSVSSLSEESHGTVSSSALPELGLDEEADALLKEGKEHLKNYDEWFWVEQYKDGADESEGERLINSAIACFLAVSQKHSYKRKYQEEALVELKKIGNMGFSIPTSSSSSSSSMSSVSGSSFSFSSNSVRVPPSFGMAMPVSSSSSPSSSSSAAMPVSSFSSSSSSVAMSISSPSSSSSSSSNAAMPVSSSSSSSSSSSAMIPASSSSSSASSSEINSSFPLERLYLYRQTILGVTKLESERAALNKRDPHFAAKYKIYAEMIATQQRHMEQCERDSDRANFGIRAYCEQNPVNQADDTKIMKSLQLPSEVLERYLCIEQEYDNQEARSKASRDQKVINQLGESMTALAIEKRKISDALGYFNVRGYAQLAKIDPNWPFQREVMRAPEAVATSPSSPPPSSLSRFLDRVSSTFSSGSGFFSKPTASKGVSSSSSAASQATVSSSSRGLMSADYDYLFKFLVIGDTSVGKSSLVLRYADDIYPESPISENGIGEDFKIRTVDVQGHKAKLQIFDLSRAQRNLLHAPNHARGAHAVVIALDVTNRESFNRIERELRDLQVGFGERHIQPVLAATKCDVYPWQVTGEEIQTFAARHNLKVYFTSAKDNSNSQINALFSATAAQIITRTLSTPGHEAKNKPQTGMGFRQ